jgi:hypothetical protein
VRNADLPVRKSLRAAIKAGDIEGLTSLILEDRSRLQWDMMFGTCLHEAARIGNLPMVKRLVELGAEIDMNAGTFKATALHDAASKGHIEVIEYLMQCGAKFDVTHPDKNPLFTAIYNSDFAVARYLIEKGLDPRVTYRGKSGDWNALIYAREWGRTEIADYIESIIDPPAPKPQRPPVQVSPFSQEVLLEAATREGTEAFRVSIEKYPNEQFYAFVFYVDNDITGAYPHAHTVESLQRVDTSADPNYYKWAPAEWQLEFGQYGDSEFMRETSALLQSKGDGGKAGFGKLKQQTLATLSQALLQIRESGIFEGHSDVKRLAFWTNVGDACGEEEWMFEPVIKHMPEDVVEELRALFEFKVRR